MKRSKEYSRKELIAMLAMLRGELHSIVYIDEEIDEERLDEIKITLEATNMDIDDEDLNDDGGFEKEWFNRFLEEYSEKE